MAGSVKIEEFLRKHQKQLTVLAVILLVFTLGLSISIQIGDINIDNAGGGNVYFGGNPEKGFNLPKIIEDICHRVFSQNGNCLGS